MSAFNVNLLTPTGPGSLASSLIREYWIPAGKSSELVAGGAPVRIQILQEKLLAFREPSGKLGIVDHMCAHRGASLFYGRNEDGGLRCAYHGWKFNASGECTDLPNVPAGRARPKIKITAYQIVEANEIFWVYMGKREVPPPLPIFAYHNLYANFTLRECNWLQGLEGDIDTSHVGFLHMGGMELDDLPEGHPSRIRMLDRAPEFDVVQTPWGNMSGAYRDCGDVGRFWGLSHYLYPFWTITANDRELAPPWFGRAWVPVDDTHVMVVTMLEKDWAFPPGLSDRDGNLIKGTAFSFGTPIPNTTDWLGRWRIEENPRNDHLIDRELQHISTLVGVDGIVEQDQAITESQGPIQDRTKEHLVPSDMMIVRTRCLLQTTAEKWIEEGVVPPGIDNPESFYPARGGIMKADTREEFMDTFNRESGRTSNFERLAETAKPQSDQPQAATQDA